jgi:hypothetical protein
MSRLVDIRPPAIDLDRDDRGDRIDNDDFGEVIEVDDDDE